jgi:hypothetical protein
VVGLGTLIAGAGISFAQSQTYDPYEGYRENVSTTTATIAIPKRFQLNLIRGQSLLINRENLKNDFYLSKGYPKNVLQRFLKEAN